MYIFILANKLYFEYLFSSEYNGEEEEEKLAADFEAFFLIIRN